VSAAPPNRFAGKPISRPALVRWRSSSPAYRTLANITIIGTLAGSAGMNIYAFASQAGSNPFMLAAAVALGLGIPSLIFAFMRVGAALWFDCQNRTV
jgi:hypothetical protein